MSFFYNMLDIDRVFDLIFFYKKDLIINTRDMYNVLTIYIVCCKCITDNTEQY